MSIERAQLGTLSPAPIPTGPAPQFDRNDAGYRIIQVTVPVNRGVSGANLYHRYSDPIRIAGDHLHVLEVTGAQTVGISLNKGSQYIPCREGDVLARSYHEFRVRSFGWGTHELNDLAGLDQSAIWTPTTEVLLLASYGQVLKHRSPIRPGFTAGSPMFQGTAIPAGDTIFHSATYTFAGGPKSLMKWGGTMMIRNRDSVNSLYLYQGFPSASGVGPGQFTMDGSIDPAASPLTAWEILPGEVLTIDCPSRLSCAWSWVDRNPKNTNRTLMIAGGNNASVPFTLWLSGLGDSWDHDGSPTTPTSLEYDGAP